MSLTGRRSSHSSSSPAPASPTRVQHSDSASLTAHHNTANKFIPLQDISSKASLSIIEMGQEEHRLKVEGRSGDKMAYGAAMASLIVFNALSITMVISAGPVSLSWFALHPPLQALAISFFAYGILTLQPTSQPQTKAAGLTRHQLLILGLGVPMISLGTWSVYHNKNINNRSHFVSWHGLLGILTVCWMFVQILVGGGSVWMGGAAFGGGMKAKSIWKYHRLSGYLLFPMFAFSLHLGGAWSSFSEKHSNEFIRFLAYTLSPAVLVIAVSSRIRTFKMQFF